MADYLSSPRLQNLFPGTEESIPANFGGEPAGGYGFMPTADQYGMDMPSQGGFGGGYNPYDEMTNGMNPNSALNSPYGMGEGYGMDFTGPMQGEGTSDYNIDQRMNQLYDPQREQGDRLNEFLSSYPERPAPMTGWRGALQKIGAVMGGANEGMGLYNEVMAPGYANKVADWKGQAGPTQQAAQIERQNNVNERQAAMGTISAELRNQAMQHKANNDEVRSKIAQQRADTYEDKQRNPDFKFSFPTNGNMMIMNPKTGEIQDSGRPVSSFSKADQMALAGSQRLEQIHATAEEARKTAEVKGGIESGHIAERGGEARTTKETPSGTPSNFKPESSTNKQTGQIIRAGQAKNTNPEWSQYIKINGKNIEVVPPSTGMFGGGPSPQVFADINKFIYGSPESDRRTAPSTQVQGVKISRQVKSKSTGAVKTQYSTDNGKTWTF